MVLTWNVSAAGAEHTTLKRGFYGRKVLILYGDKTDGGTQKILSPISRYIQSFPSAGTWDMQMAPEQIQTKYVNFAAWIHFY